MLTLYSTEIIEQRDPLANVKVFFLPCDPAYTFVKKKAQFTGFFDRVFIGNSLAHRIPDAETLLKPNGLLIAENIKYVKLWHGLESVLTNTDKLAQVHDGLEQGTN